METLIYILKVNLVLSVLYLTYHIFFRKDTFFKFKRYFFLFGILFAFAYPIIQLEIPQLSDADTKVIQTVNLDTIQIGLEPNSIQASSQLFSTYNIVLGILSIVTTLMLLKLCGQILYILALRKRAKRSQLNNSTVYCIDNEEINPFSFFRCIFINPGLHSAKELDEIIKHESIHAQQWHSIDSITGEMLTSLFWWNPLVWLLKKEMKINLEYIVDQEVLSVGIDAKQYQYHLLKLSYKGTTAVVNNFNVSQLKNRITMMNKKKSLKSELVKYLLILPIIAALAILNFKIMAQDKTQKVYVANLVEVKGPVKSEDMRPFTAAEIMPKFVGGESAMMEYIKSELKYPEVAKNDKTEGRVIARFVVSANGSIKDAQILKGLSKECDEETLRVINKMPKWIPGAQNGKAVDVYFTIPVQYSLTQNKDNTVAK